MASNVLFPVSDVGQYGIVTDRKAQELPPNAWSGGLNVRARNGFMEKFTGESVRMGTPTVAPYAIAACPTQTQYLWMYASLAKAYAYDGTTHTEITRAVGGDYAATADKNWVITNLMGIPVMTNGIDIPQMWTPVNSAQKLQALSNWNVNWKCQSIRAFRNFLVAMDVTKTGTRDPQMVKWSHGAASGGVPSSWDETDTTKDAGEYSISDSPGFVLDGIPMRDALVIYKEDSIWAMQYIAGSAVFRFIKLFDFIGAISRRCAVEFFSGKHLVFGVNDIVLHDGQSMQSVINNKMRRYFMDRINPDVYQRCFVAMNPQYREVWCCAPTVTNTFCDTALVWNWEENTVTLRSIPNIAYAANGIVNDGLTDTWSSASGDWASDTLAWDVRAYNPALRKLFLARPSSANIFLADDTNTFNTVAMTATLERKHLGIPFRVNQPPDMQSMKMVTGVYPRIEGTPGGVVNVYVGSAPDVYTDPTYQGPFPFTIGTTKKINCLVSGRLPAVKFESTTDVDWRLHGYEVEVKQIGKY